MNFKGHFTGAVAAGVVAAGTAIVSGYVAVDTEAISNFAADPFRSSPLHVTFWVYAVAWFMALFPDLDTASIIQRWFYRLLLILLGYLLIKKKIDVFAVFAFLGVLPLLDKHRGWTHWRMTPWIISFGLAIVFEYFRIKNNWFLHFKWQNVLTFLQTYWIYVFACVVGHYTHLMLDSAKAKKIAFLKKIDKQ